MKQSKKDLLLKGMKESEQLKKQAEESTPPDIPEEVLPEIPETHNDENQGSKVPRFMQIKESIHNPRNQGSKVPSITETKVSDIKDTNRAKNKPKIKRDDMVELYTNEGLEKVRTVRTTIDINKDILDKLNYLKTMYHIKTGKRISMMQMFQYALSEYLDVMYKKFKEIDDVNPFDD